jgi:hypothetical protein
MQFIYTHAPEVVQRDEAVFDYEVDDSMFLGDLHDNWEIICSLWRKVKSS